LDLRLTASFIVMQLRATPAPAPRPRPSPARAPCNTVSQRQPLVLQRRRWQLIALTRFNNTTTTRSRSKRCTKHRRVHIIRQGRFLVGKRSLSDFTWRTSSIASLLNARGLLCKRSRGQGKRHIGHGGDENVQVDAADIFKISPRRAALLRDLRRRFKEVIQGQTPSLKIEESAPRLRAVQPV